MFIQECIKQSKCNKIINYVAFGTLVLAFTQLLIILYWLTYPYNPLTINEQPAKVISKEVKAGEMLTVETNYCKNLHMVATVTRSFIDGVIYTSLPVITNNSIGCRKVATQVPVPSGLPSGPYKMRTVYEYKVNPLRTVEVTSMSEEFYVIGLDLDKQEDKD